MPSCDRCLRIVEPFYCRRNIFLCLDVDDVAVFEIGVEGDKLSIYFRAEGVVADVGVNGVGKVDGARVGGKIDNVTLGGKNENPVGEKVHLESLKKFTRLGGLIVKIKQVFHPGVFFSESFTLFLAVE